PVNTLLLVSWQQQTYALVGPRRVLAGAWRLALLLVFVFGLLIAAGSEALYTLLDPTDKLAAGLAGVGTNVGADLLHAGGSAMIKRGTARSPSTPVTTDANSAPDGTTPTLPAQPA